jgi:hypothetical protein
MYNKVTFYRASNKLVKNTNLNLDVSLNPKINDEPITLPYLITESNYNIQSFETLQKRPKLRRKLLHVENICRSYYTKPTANMNNIRNKTMVDLLIDSKVKAIDEITNDFNINGYHTNSLKEDNKQNIKNNNSYIFTNEILKKLHNRSLNKNKIKKDMENKIVKKNPYEEKFNYLKETNEINEKKIRNNNHHSVETKNTDMKIRYKFGDFATNKVKINHRQIYMPKNIRRNENSKLPIIIRQNRRLNIIKDISKIIPDSVEIINKKNQIRYDEFMIANEFKMYL